MNPEARHLTAARILRVWFGLGIQSFGGGVATLALIRRAAVDDEKWVTDEEFARYWGICQVAPGINLFALTILISRKVGGWAGIAAALLGLVLPSVTITILMTALYARLRNASAVQAALHGILPATIGLGIVASFKVVRPLAVAAHREGLDSLAVTALVLAGSAAAVGLLHAPVVVVLVGAGLVSAAHAAIRARGRKPDAPS